MEPNYDNRSESSPHSRAQERFVGIDVGAETIKLVELLRENGLLTVSRLEVVEHGKKPGPVLLETVRNWDWANVDGAAVSGRFSNRVKLPRIPTKQAQLNGFAFLFPERPGTVVNIGSQGFSVLEIHPDGLTHFRENSRCSQGTGNFLRQLVERFSLTVEEAGVLCANETQPAPLSGRCPVILKTDMTHLANKGEDRARILAGLFDAVCENVLLLLKPGSSPRRVLLVGGVSRAPRVRRTFAASVQQRGMEFVQLGDLESVCLEAFGCAVAAAADPVPPCPVAELILPASPLKLERLQSLGASLHKVKRLTSEPLEAEPRNPVVLGLDIGSTGSKLVGLDAVTEQIVWEDYRRTLGDPVGAAQDLLGRFTKGRAGHCPIVAFGATGSGREVAGSLLTSCYGKVSVYIVNEIVAHATGALYFEPRVDTIFEIGGQDAKYIRLHEGRVTDCAMNEACSAGTGSFIEEQGSKFAGISDVRELGKSALAARSGVSLGQHCSVFMAEVIDEAVASGVDQGAILSGLYDSIIKNYLNRVKGNRSVGKVIFCQGMPFSADALASAVARQSGCEVIVPPNPGTVGALGIALLARRELQPALDSALDPARFREARVEQKDAFICRSTTGCGGGGNRCRIERLRTVVGGARSAFTWGGGCSLHDKGTRKRKLPNLAPDPFRERAELLQRTLAPFTQVRGNRRVALSEEFMLKGLVPFFAAFFHRAGLDVVWVEGADQATLKRGIQSASIAFCAPMQLFHGVREDLFNACADWIFIPMVRSIPGVEGQTLSVVCPVVQAGPDLMRTAAGGEPGSIARMLSPVIDFGPSGFASPDFERSCQALGRSLGLSSSLCRHAIAVGRQTQREFDDACLELGKRALQFCRERDIVPVVVLGRNYTIYSTSLNSNVPAILREQGAIAIPLDCYPTDKRVPIFHGMYWGYGQAVLRAAHEIRRTQRVYGLYCSNYSCGPDSFNLHFASHIMEGKPFVVIETDGHCGDAGTKTRVEAFLHCVHEDRLAASATCEPNDFSIINPERLRPSDFRDRGLGAPRVLVPYMGPSSEVVTSALRGIGLSIETLPMPGVEALRAGRRYTSGKECLPLPFTLGSLLIRLEDATEKETFIYLMPASNGPCRLGVYNMLSRIVLDRLGWRERLKVWSPHDRNYFEGLPGGMELVVYSGILASDLLLQSRLDTRPFEKVCGRVDALYARYHSDLLALVEKAGREWSGAGTALWEAISGRLFELPALLRRAAADFAAVAVAGERPTVELTGEIYLRSVDSSNDHVIEKLEARGMRVRIAPTSEWLAYCSYLTREAQSALSPVAGLRGLVQHRIEDTLHRAVAEHLDPHRLPSTAAVLRTASPYVSPALDGEAVLTVGATLHAWRLAQIDAVLNVGPLECMPTKVAEAQFHALAAKDGLLSLTLSFDGNPVNLTVLDNFAYEVHARFRKRSSEGRATTNPAGVPVPSEKSS